MSECKRLAMKAEMTAMIAGDVSIVTSLVFRRSQAGFILLIHPGVLHAK